MNYLSLERFLRLIALSVLLMVGSPSAGDEKPVRQAPSSAKATAGKQARPNILWIVQEDTSPWMGCYGYKANIGQTPNIDRMAKAGVLFKRAYVPAAVCSPCRSAFIVGASQIRMGTQEHRSRRYEGAPSLPKGVKTLPELFLEAGYETFNVGKTDYNFTTAKPLYSLEPSETKPWAEALKRGKPFFGQIQLRGGKNNTNRWPKEKKADPAKAVVPADYPQNEIYQKIVSKHCDAIRMDDGVIGKILEELKSDGLEDNTIVVYFSDHGANNLVRHKQMPTEGGLHVPLIIRGPKRWVPKGAIRNDLVSILDVSATSLAWAGIKLPSWVEGQDLFGRDFKERGFVGAARDRCDFTIDKVRTIRTDVYRYTRNYKRDRILLQPQYRDKKNFVRFLRDAYAEGTLAPKLAEIYFGERPAEELYNINKDPAQVNNLAKDPKYTKELERHRRLLDRWLAKGDMGQQDEPKKELELNSIKKSWRVVNPEFEAIRNDNDGDGLSDPWEKLNKRDPNDGKLQFEFNCGGWQTEGWKADKNLSNIAGRLGFLDFDFLAPKATLSRSGLNLDTAKNPGNFAIRLRSTAQAKISLYANNALIGHTACQGNDTYATVTIPLGDQWKGAIKALELRWEAPLKTRVEIDWIRTTAE